jgi:hypothetical protein
MILLLAFGLAVAWGLLRGGQLSQLKFLPLQGIWLALIAFTVQVLLVYASVPLGLNGLIRVLILAFTYALLVGFVWLNRRLQCMWVLGAGLVANLIVILANGGYMPISYETLQAAGLTRLVSSTASGTLVFGTKDILLTTAETRFWFLSDIFVVPPPLPLQSVFSLGDALIAVGMFRFIAHALGVPARVPLKSQSA